MLIVWDLASLMMSGSRERLSSELERLLPSALIHLVMGLPVEAPASPSITLGCVSGGTWAV